MSKHLIVPASVLALMAGGAPAEPVFASFGNTTENAILDLIYRATAWANVAQNGTSPITSIANSLHTADPGEAGTMSTSEAAYTSYARVDLARSTGYNAASSGSTSYAANCDFPASTGAGSTITHVSTGKTGGGATDIFLSGTVTPNIAVGGAGITPRLTTSTTFSID